MPFASLQSSGGTDLVQEESGVHSAGYVQMDEKMICGETWDLAASQVVCRELGWGPPVEVAGYAKDFLGSLSESPCHVLKILHGRGWYNNLYVQLHFCKVCQSLGGGSMICNFGPKYACI